MGHKNIFSIYITYNIILSGQWTHYNLYCSIAINNKYKKKNRREKKNINEITYHELEQ